MKPSLVGRSYSAGTHNESLPPSSRRFAREEFQGGMQKAHKSQFKRALKRIEVPPALQQGIPVIRVFANGQKPKQQYLTLSRDKFTLHITSAPIHARHLQEKKHSRGGSWIPSLLKRNSSVDSVVNAKGLLPEAAEGKLKRANKEVQAIDIGAIHRIQRGAHNANLKTTTTSAETVQNLTRRTRSDLKKNRHDSFLSQSPGPSPTISFRKQTSVSGAPGIPMARSSSSSISSVHAKTDAMDVTNPDPVANANFNFRNPNFQSGVKKGVLSRGRSSVSSVASYAGSQATEAIDPGLCFSIIFRGDWTLDLMMPDFDIMTTKTKSASSSSSRSNGAEESNSSRITRDKVIDALDNLVRAYSTAKRQVSNEVLLLRYVWSDVDVDKTNLIKQNELGAVFERINYQMKKSELNSRYTQFCKVIGLTNKKQGLTFEQTCTLLHKTKRDSWTRKPVHQYWNDLFGEFMNNNKPRMHVSKKTFLEKFLREKQGERHATMADVDELFKRLNEVELPHVSGEAATKDPNRIDRDRFEVYLLGEDNDAFDPRRESYKDNAMHRPISEYWVNSSHNTYLTGDQFASNSSIDMYSSALYRGCKCLELDVWDGGYSEGEPVPIVYHGHTMTSKILYKDIIKAIKLYVNFHPDTFPLILSYENHCTIPFQEIMAAQLVEILGDSLYIPREDSLQSRLPSPSDLRGMVVIKGRRPTELDDFDDRNSDFGAPSTVMMSENSSTQYSQQQKTTLQKVCPALARLTLFHGTKLKGWDTSLTNPTHYMHSFSETKVSKLSKRPDRQKWVIYNQSHMSRSYPAGSRLDSSNYSPILPWAMGVQLVALNFQTVDAPLLLNDGRFRENGGCGYVLKSTKLIDYQEPPNKYNRDSRVPTRLGIRILSGSCIPKPNDAHTGDCINPYVRVSVYDVKSGNKETTSTFSTEYVANNGFFPIWNGDEFSFKVENYETAMLHMSVLDKGSAIANAAHTTVLGDELIASSSIPISCLRKGLRSVKLYDTSNTRSGAFDFASLLVDIKIKKERIEDIIETTKPRSWRFGDGESTMAEI
eukprot:CAMPEP_0116120770 /NCGR_PEP_ID=MMETSP0329-20121206/3349_1 /TAXON_ID=697910 /ORGANISM="Pseudo-nitzschia arenysensis, Strain B593" /LENGTH=1047 /DNA_ID=CAMNT_0003614555 /DNA_START=263 /DNA_END=3405 /DNA_ORIENTATION=+